MKKLLPLLLLALSTVLTAQEVPMEVYRGNAIKYSAIVFNFHVDESNNKWVGTADGLFQVHDPTLASRVELAEGEESLLRLPDGNRDIRWKTEDLIAITGDIFDRANYITAGHYDSSRKELWLGTSQFGLYQFKVEPKLELVEQYTIYNSKLKSDYINTIYIDAAGRQWIGTQDGVLFGEKGRWQLLERGADIRDVAGKGLEIWLMTEDRVGPLDARQRWSPIDIPRFKTEGRLRNIAFDDKGNLWIASEVITRYNTESQEFTVFGPAQEYTSQFASCLAADRDNAIWVGTQDKGLYIVDKASAMRVTVLPDEEISCNGNGKDASLKVEVYGGQAPYTYQWSGGLAGAHPQNLAPGEYQLTVTDAKGKSKTITAIVEDKRVEAVAAMVKTESGPAAADGSASVKVKGGATPYSYRWDNGETAPTATKLSAGQHNVTVTDKNGCQSVSSLNITQDLAELAAELSLAEEVKCFGTKGATLEIETTGGKEPYDFQWSQAGLAGARVKGLAAGAYSVTVADAAGNTAIAQFAVPQPDALTATATAVAPASTGMPDGQARVSAAGGTPGYLYEWDSGEKGENSDDLAAGRHTVTVTDANGCTAIASVDITEDILPLALAVQQTAEINCFGGSQAALQVEASGGKGPFQYKWSREGITGQAPAGLSAGDYAVTVTDAAGNAKTAQVSIPQPNELKAAATATAPASTGNADGQAAATASGGNGGFAFKWDNGETAAQATQLAPGTRTVTVTDAKGCSATATVDISENILPLALSIQQTAEINCFGGSQAALQVEASGGKGPFQYKWSQDGISGQAPAGLSAGDYAVTVTDATGNAKTAQVSIPQPNELKAAATATAPASTGNADGQAAATASGGNGGFAFKWDNGETAAQATQLAPGTRTVTVTDAKGCSATATVDISENILPLALAVQQTAEIDCFGGSQAALQVDASGGKGPFQYKWSREGVTGQAPAGLSAGDYTVTVTDAAGNAKTAQVSIPQPNELKAAATATAPASTGNADGQATATASGGNGGFAFKWDNGETAAQAIQLAPGSHSVTATDAKGCSATATVDISENILPLALSIQQTAEIDCFGGSQAALQVQASGGKGPFQYKWSREGVSGQAPAGLSAGDYAVTVTDATGNAKTAQVSIPQPNKLKAAATATAPASTGNADGQATATASGGNGGFAFKWDNGETAAQATQLAPGSHSVTATDAKGCSATATVDISENILPLALAVQQTAEINCFGGSQAALQVEASGGKGPFKYQWSQDGVSGQAPAGLTAGDYTVTITDAMGTEQAASFSIPQPAVLEAEAEVISPASTNNSDGQATGRASGGTAPYSYKWGNGEEGAGAKALAPGIHTVTVVDNRGCTATASVEVSENILPLKAAIRQAVEINCFGEQNAAIQVEVKGGKGPYQYQWSDGAMSGGEAAGLAAGDYAVTVTDVTGAAQSARISIRQPEALTVRITDKEPAFSDASNDGKATAEAEGGNGGYSFRWDNGATGSRVENLPLGRHAVTVTDSKGCVASTAFETTERIMKELASGAVRSGQTIQMQKLQFEADSTNITEDNRPILDEIYVFLKDNPSIVVEIGGHTNNLPPPEYCDQLSTDRARAVAEYLVQQGIDPDRVFYKGYGKRKPLFSNGTEDGRRRNQRVEIKILRL